MVQQIFIPTTYAPNNSRVIFLAGPIQGAPDWQTDAVKTLTPDLQSAVIASPRRVVSAKDFVYEEQINWETYHLKLAGANGVILFWLAKQSTQMTDRAYAQTTRAELFEWKERHLTQNAKLVVGIEKGFTGERYIRMRLAQDCPDINILDDLNSVCKYAIELL